jgi:hypothetical protein
MKAIIIPMNTISLGMREITSIRILFIKRINFFFGYSSNRS